MTYIFGIGGNATSIYNLMLDLNIDVTGFIVDDLIDDRHLNLPVSDIQSIRKRKESIDCVVSVGHNYSRELIVKKIEEAFQGKVNFPSLIHNTAYVSSMAELGKGVVVFPGGKIGPRSRVGDFVQLNTNSSIDHDCQIADFGSLAPAAVTGGNVTVGRRTAILLNSAISNGIRVGEDVVLAAMSFLRDNTRNCEFWAGSPAECKKFRNPSDLYF